MYEYHQEAASFQEESDWARLANPAYIAQMLELSPDEISSKIAMHLHEAASLFNQQLYAETIPIFRATWELYTQAGLEDEGLCDLLTSLTMQACLQAGDNEALIYFLNHYSLSEKYTGPKNL